ncbi:MAG: DinB family protein [Candidatus Promineifilaceae bacterium]|nr:DinB family protein [Candidatus Promineifilaceae bacterium]
MEETRNITRAIFEGWHDYQQLLIEAIAPLQEDDLERRAASHLRSVGENAQHIIAARAYWFHRLMGEGGEQFASLATWDDQGAPSRSAEELVKGLEQTWRGMHMAIDSWSDEDWQQTWPGRGNAPEAITRQWIIWHLIEHDLHHGGEISLTLGIHNVAAPPL